MKKILSILLLFPFLTSAVTAPLEVQSVLNRIELVEEGKALLNKHHDIQIRFISRPQFEAYWYPEARMICLSEANRRHPERLLRSVLFELHNAESTPQMQSLHNLARARRISKNEYIRRCEQIEFENSLSTMDILEKGIAAGKFPLASRWWMPRSFSDYFKLQMQSGHAAYHGGNYDRLTT